MAYNKSEYQLTHLIQDVWTRLGAMSIWKITGGSTTTVVNTAWAGVDDEIFEDDDSALIYGSVVVVEDAGGAGAAPEGEIARITDYDSSSQTITHDALTAAPASGDRVGIASPQYPYEDMKAAVNIALRKLGKIDLIDTSLSVLAGQTEYTLPIQAAPKQVRIYTTQASGDYKPELVSGWRVRPATAGSFWTLILPDLPQGYTLELLYEEFHPKLDSFEDDIVETIVPELAVAATMAEVLQWYNNRISGSNAYLLQRENKAIQDLESARALYPIKRINKQIQGLPHWGTRMEYVPLTSDERA